MFYKNRDKFKNLSVNIGIIFSKVGLSPNQWTVLAILPALIAVYFLAKETFFVAAILFIVSAFVDLVDGSVARVTGRVSKLGAYLDTIVDRYIEFIIIFGLLFATLPGFYVSSNIWIFIYLLGSFMTTYTKAAAKEKDLVEKEVRGGLLERAERLIILFIGILIASINKLYLTYILVILAVLTNITALQRIRLAIKANKKHYFWEK